MENIYKPSDVEYRRFLLDWAEVVSFIDQEPRLDYSLSDEEERQMDLISNAVIDLMLTNPSKHLKYILKKTNLILTTNQKPN